MREILGNKEGLKSNIITSLEKLYDLPVPSWQLLSAEMAVEMARITSLIHREINVFLDRKGKVLAVVVGDNHLQGRRGSGRLSGIRCIHTHPAGNPQLSGVDMSALRNNKYDVMAAIGVNEEKPETSVLNFAVLTGRNSDGQYAVQEFGSLKPSDLENLFLPNIISSAEKLLAPVDDDKTLEQRPEWAWITVNRIPYGPRKTLWKNCGN